MSARRTSPLTAGKAREEIRIIATNDLFGAVLPAPTSYGRLPGAQGLTQLVEDLRSEGKPSIWIDGGDFAQGGPLATASGGTLGFEAAASLGIDVAVAGNHEFDWGREHLERCARSLPFPLLAANDEIALPGVSRHELGGWLLGVIGLTQLDQAPPSPFWTVGDPSRNIDKAIGLAERLARELRADGADAVILVVHDGVEPIFSPTGAPSADPGQMARLSERMCGLVDVVIGAHSLARWQGPLAGVPFVQPAAFGAEVMTIDLHPQRPPVITAAIPSRPMEWEGPGAELARKLNRREIGRLHASVRQQPHGDRTLGELIAAGMVQLSGAANAIVMPWELCTQPPLDGVYAYLPAGVVTEADVMRVIPYTGEVVPDAINLTTITPTQLDRLLSAMPKAFGPPAIARGAGRDHSLAVSTHFVGVFDDWLGEQLDWTRLDIGLRDALTHAIAVMGKPALHRFTVSR
jgi:2',3'-cyclic-nucleotide 2'-phosphodiesterase (5'-nucleotidase family)